MVINNSIQKKIPKGWQEQKLSSIGVFSKGAGISKEQLSEKGHNAVRYGELYTRFNFQIKHIYSRIPDEVIPLTKKIKYGDILFAGSGETIDEIGKSAAYLLHEECYAGGDVIIFRPKNVNSLFLSYFLNIGEGRKKLRELGQGQSIVHIYKSDLESLKLHLPTLPEQKRIVAVLETWDGVIEKLGRKIEIKKNLKKGLTQKLLTGKLRLSGFTGSWEDTRLAKLITSVSERNRKLQETRVLSVTNKLGFILPEQQFARVVASEDLTNYKVIKKGDFAYNPSRINVGSISRLETYDSGILSPMYIAFRPKDLVSSDYLFQWIFTKEANSKIRNMASGSVRESVDFKSFCSIKIKLPDLKEQIAIAKIFITSDQEIACLEKKLSVLIRQKTYLLNNLITGAIRTPENLKVN